MTNQVKVLILEDELSIRSFIRINLRRFNYYVLEASTGEEALELMDSNTDIKIALLDVMLPGIDGFAVCSTLRRKYPHLGIIMLTAKGQEQDKIQGLEIGADDYIVKPFSPKELIARIEALLRRVNNSKPILKGKTKVNDGFVLDLAGKKFLKDNKEISLTPTEFNIVSLLINNLDKALTRDEILDNVWGKNYIGDIKIVDVNIRRIRQKIESDSSNPKYIKTVRGYGYVWNTK